MRPRKQAMMTTLLRLLIPAMRRFDEHYPAAVQARYRRSDCLLRVLARFVFQQPNWFRFEPRWRDRPAFLRSLQHWFQLEEIPSDTTIRRRWDALLSTALRGLFAVVFREAQRQQLREPFRSPIDAHYLVAVDGTGGVSSTTIHCDSCLHKHHRQTVVAETGEELPLITYSHQTLGAVVVHPHAATVLPLCPETIGGRLAADVQDSEWKAAPQWFVPFRRAHPKLAGVFLGDARYANGPFIQALDS